MINGYKILVGKREEQRRLGSLWRKWEDNIEIVRWGDVAQDRDQWRGFRKRRGVS
jgi:hypothetical protein